MESVLAYNGFDDVAQSSQVYQRYHHSCEFRTPFEAEIAFPPAFLTASPNNKAYTRTWCEKNLHTIGQTEMHD